MVWISMCFYIALIVLIVWIMNRNGKKSRKEGNNKQDGYVRNNAQPPLDMALFKTVEDCLLQQTTDYRRGVPYIFATNEDNELFLVYFYPNTFYISKVMCENNKFNIVYDYRYAHPLFKDFKYKKKKDRIEATLEFKDKSLDFIITPDMEYSGSGCTFKCDQSSLYEEFASHVETYRENILNEVKSMNKKDDGYFTLKKHMAEVSDRDKMRISQLIEMGHQIDAIKMIQQCTGLGLSESKTIADNPAKYIKYNVE